MAESPNLLIERYQSIFSRDPTSRIFAPLAEAYRKAGDLDAAQRVASLGVGTHPNFASGRVALARIYIERSLWAEAIEQLEKAATLSSDNVLALHLLAESYLRVKQAKKALNAYKRVLFLSPHDKRAARAAQRLESLEAEDYEADLFTMTRVSTLPVEDFVEKHLPETAEPPTAERLKAMERFVSLADAFIVRHDAERALKVLKQAEERLGAHPEIASRVNLIRQRASEWQTLKGGIDVEDATPIEPLPSRKDLIKGRKKRFLETLLKTVAKRRAE